MTVMLQCLLSCMAMVHLAVVLLLKLFCHSTYSCPLSIPHAANFAHTDVRWPNVIKCSNDTFCLIELETAVILGCKWNLRLRGPHRVGWENKTLAKGRYTASSDLALVGQLLTDPGSPALGEAGSHFAEELMAKSLCLQQALQHVWLQS